YGRFVRRPERIVLKAQCEPLIYDLSVESSITTTEFIAAEYNMSRVLVIGSDAQVSRKIGDGLSSGDFPMEYSAGHADALQRLRMRSFGVVITNPDSTVEEDLALLEEMRAIRPGVKS